MAYKSGIIFDIQRFSIHDGPGIRTIVFLKGCSLSCLWCQNPESIRKRKEIMFIERRCISCGKCQEVCPLEAINFESRERVDRSRCDLCGQCIGVCDANALRMVGREITTALLLEEVMRDLPFYMESGGGVTLSGGEPLKKTLIRLIPSFVSRMSEGRQQLRIEKRQPLMASAI